MGRLLRLFWWHMLEGRPGAWHDFAACAAFETAVVVAGLAVLPETGVLVFAGTRLYKD
jgi:hypothetical protein